MLLAGARSRAVPLLEERIAVAGLKESIRFAGIRNDIERLMAGSDVFLFPSRGEGLGMAAVEAQAAGLPVLASDTVPPECIVVPELVHFKKVLLGEEAWAVEVLRLAERPRNNLDANRRVAVSEFSIQKSCRRLLQLYALGRLAGEECGPQCAVSNEI
jgi:glycosyltransferase involved in cell wall biosynthesis